MKKLLLSFCLLVVAGAASAQVAFGIKAGFQTSLGFDENWNFNAESLNVQTQDAYGFDIGLMMRIGHRFYGQLEVNYAYEQSKYMIDNDPTQVQEVLDQSINVPVLFGIKLIDLNSFNLRIMVGPTFNFNVGNKGAVEVPDLQAEMRPCSFGLDCGLGMDFWMFALDVRYRLVQPGYSYKAEDINVNTNPVNSFEVCLAWKFLDKTK